MSYPGPDNEHISKSAHLSHVLFFCWETENIIKKETRDANAKPIVEVTVLKGA